LLAVILASRPDGWPDWLRTSLIAALSAAIAAGLVVWRTQGIIEAKLEALDHKVERHEKIEDKEHELMNGRIQRNNERLSRHIENHGGVTWPNVPKK